MRLRRCVRVRRPRIAMLTVDSRVLQHNKEGDLVRLREGWMGWAGLGWACADERRSGLL